MIFSLCMIVKNEEKTLARCLDSVKGVFDEIIIVDTGSSDKTKEVAHTYTDKIYDFKWCDDFSAARNFSFSKASGDYIMWLDADDVLDDANRTALLALKESLSPETDLVMMRYTAAFDSAGNPAFFYYRERLIKRLGGFRWIGFIHEVIPPNGNVLRSDITVYHLPDKDKHSDPTRNLRLYEKRLAAGAKLNARETYYYARELHDNGKNELAAKHFEEFLTLPAGWYADKIGACLILAEIYEERMPQRAKEYLARALSYDAANPQVLCRMGDMQKKAGRTDQAIFWYQAALICPKHYAEDGFVAAEYERYYPYLQLCVCYDTLGEYALARESNRLAGIEQPDSEQVKHNNAYFASLIEKGVLSDGKTQDTEEEVTSPTANDGEVAEASEQNAENMEKNMEKGLKKQK